MKIYKTKKTYKTKYYVKNEMIETVAFFCFLVGKSGKNLYIHKKDGTTQLSAYHYTLTMIDEFKSWKEISPEEAALML